MKMILKRPKESLPKVYKEYAKDAERLVSKFEKGKYKKEVEIERKDIPKLFALDEEHINLPDMNLEELKLIFPYFFDAMCYLGPYRESMSLEKFQKIYELSQTKRIPLTLGAEYEGSQYAVGMEKREKLKKSLQTLIEQVEPEIIESYMPLILKAGLFPGVDLDTMNIKTWKQLVNLWHHYFGIRNALIHTLYWYSAPEEEYSRYNQRKSYAGNKIEVAWEIIEFLQIRLREWEVRAPLSSEEKSVMESLENSVKNQAKDSSVVFDKATLNKAVLIAHRWVLDQEENGRRLRRFMEMDEQRQAETKPFRWRSEWGKYQVSVDGVTVTMFLQDMDMEHSRLDECRIEGLEGGLKLTFCEGKKEYIPVLCYEDIWKNHKYQSYAKMRIEDENGKQIEIEIPHIVSFRERAFKKVNLKEIEIRGTIQSFERETFRNCTSLEEVRFISEIPMASGAFENCTNLKKAVLPRLDDIRRVKGLFINCMKLTSITDPEGVDILKMNSKFSKEENTIYQKDFLWWPSIIESGAEKLVFVREDEKLPDFEYHASGCSGEIVCSCDNIKEIKVLNGTKVIGREFSKCRNLQKIILPESVEEIFYKAFEECDQLKKIELPRNAVVIIEDYERDSLAIDLHIFEKLRIPENHAFYKRQDSILYSEKGTLIEWASPDVAGKVEIPEGVEIIGDSAFRNCKNITEVILPASLRKIECGAFFGCTSLKKIVVQSRHVWVDASCSWQPEDYYKPKPLFYEKKYVFDSEVELEYTNLPKGVVKIPEGVKWISAYEFAGCSELTEIILPRTIEHIAEYAFLGCDNLKKVILYGKAPWRYPEEVFGVKIPKIEFRHDKSEKELTYRPFAGVQELLKKKEE